jgi:hypothetical protein
LERRSKPAYAIEQLHVRETPLAVDDRTLLAVNRCAAFEKRKRIEGRRVYGHRPAPLARQGKIPRMPGDRRRNTPGLRGLIGDVFAR